MSQEKPMKTSIINYNGRNIEEVEDFFIIWSIMIRVISNSQRLFQLKMLRKGNV